MTCDYNNSIILTESEVHKMKDLQMIATECIRDLNAIGIYPHCKAEDFSVNTRAKQRWGQCRKKGDKYSINISNRLLYDDIDDMATKTTVMHELLHSCDNAMEHKHEWLRLANKVNRAYGYNIKRCTSASEKMTDEQIKRYNKPVEHAKTYICTCGKCGKVIAQYHRRSKFIQAIDEDGAVKWFHGKNKCGYGYKFSYVVK